jgi:hypothetical protein
VLVLQPPTWFFLWRSGRWEDLFGRPRS